MKRYPHYLIDVSRGLRQRSTEAEALLWEHLRDKRLMGIKFRRQHSIGRYIVDFYAPALKLVVEVDGPIHLEAAQREYDMTRSRILATRGCTVLRLTNDEVLLHTARALSVIAFTIKQLNGVQQE